MSSARLQRRFRPSTPWVFRAPLLRPSLVRLSARIILGNRVRLYPMCASRRWRAEHTRQLQKRIPTVDDCSLGWNTYHGEAATPALFTSLVVRALGMRRAG